VFVDVKMRRLWNFGERKVFWGGLEVLALEKHFYILDCYLYAILFFIFSNKTFKINEAIVPESIDNRFTIIKF
jgi:hypothetical protein